jgi:hypothetical protein
MGKQGCGLPAAAFCDDFEKDPAPVNRAGELDPARWSAGRFYSQLPTGNNRFWAVGPSRIPNCLIDYSGDTAKCAGDPTHVTYLPDCHAGLTSPVLPDQDAVICDPSNDIKSRHLLVAAGAQNYGMTSLRVRQPFDFAGRTGKIVFDAEGIVGQAGLLGWMSFALTEDPMNAPTLTESNEGGTVPRNGIELHFDNSCGGGMPKLFSLGALRVYKGFVETNTQPKDPPCLSIRQGKLNHFEVLVSQTKIEVYVSDLSDDGVAFPAPKLVFSQAVDLPFSRGYVHIASHNHATLKYSCDPDANGDCKNSKSSQVDSWVVRWDNVGFDGPVVSNWHDYSTPDSLKSVPNVNVSTDKAVSLGYEVLDSAGPAKEKIPIHGVDLTDATSARLTGTLWFGADDPTKVTLSYRFNGKTWTDHKLTAEDIVGFKATAPDKEGSVSLAMDVPLADLSPGDNTVEFRIASANQGGYPPGLVNVDLIVTTK